MPLVALKNVRKDAWLRFKSESARHGMNMSSFFEHLLREHTQDERRAKAAWNKILYAPPRISIKDATDLRRSSRDFRRGFEFRT
ncbi:hypothetical protein HY642_01840 [Candidatus Woesearchaeota archaeon]|nr:hypothetical protein [Candidatus Woesearchaeota archaeon]